MQYMNAVTLMLFLLKALVESASASRTASDALYVVGTVHDRQL